MPLAAQTPVRFVARIMAAVETPRSNTAHASSHTACRWVPPKRENRHCRQCAPQKTSTRSTTLHIPKLPPQVLNPRSIVPLTSRTPMKLQLVRSYDTITTGLLYPSRGVIPVRCTGSNDVIPAARRLAVVPWRHCEVSELWHSHAEVRPSSHLISDAEASPSPKSSDLHLVRADGDPPSVHYTVTVCLEQHGELVFQNR